MKYRELPRTGWKISEISYGCMSLGVGHRAKSIGHRANERLLHKAVDLGINYFDTADLYDKGENERIVGLALGAWRQSVFIATKVGNQWRPDGSGWDWNPNKEYILQAVEGSLKRLKTDYIDLYQLHGGTIEDPIDETIEAFEILKEQGKIRAYGISSIRPNVIKEYVKRSNIVSVMMQYSLLDRRPEESCLELLADHDIGVLVRGAVAKGLLIDKPAKEYLGYSAEETTRARDAVAWGSKDEVQETRDDGRETKEDGRGMRGRTASQTALQFALKGPAVYSVAAGMRTEEQLVDNVGAVEASGLTEEEYEQLRSALPVKVYEAHR